MAGQRFRVPSALFVAGLAITAALLSACARPTGTIAAFERGRVDGCNSGLSDANKPGYDTRYAKNEPRYGADGNYRAGWDEGYDTCYWREYNNPTWESGVGGM